MEEVPASLCTLHSALQHGFPDLAATSDLADTQALHRPCMLQLDPPGERMKLWLVSHLLIPTWLSREKAMLQYQGTKLSQFPDLVEEVSHKYADVKLTLQSSGYRYGMLYPARLPIELNGKHYILKLRWMPYNSASNII
ncbi:hypothetical protein NDU88_003767 [Pleurodeles waltl]|uniref:Uncharacterized protein n=1 Tax=Pleurodeles waltl TaxID=8319 RepID=A0AAV7NQL8_PLEWA|nr:hypothetical protein NDU88_003767 [Pleurodeles waltl]